MKSSRQILQTYKAIIGIAVALTIPFIVGCEEPPGKKEFEESVIAKAEALVPNNKYVPLKYIAENKGDTFSSSGNLGGFFLFGFGGVDGSSSAKSKPYNTVTFMWYSPSRGYYTPTTMDLKNVRFVIDNTVDIPEVMFQYTVPPYSMCYNHNGWSKNSYGVSVHCHKLRDDDEQSVLSFVNKAIIKVNELNWPGNIIKDLSKQ